MAGEGVENNVVSQEALPVEVSSIVNGDASRAPLQL